MVNRIFIVLDYTPGFASANRMFALAQEFTRNKLDVHLILFSKLDFDLPCLENVSAYKIVGNTLKSYFNISNIIKRNFCNGSVVYSYGIPLLSQFLDPKRYPLFCEYTEIPLYGKKSSLVGRIKERIKLRYTLRASGVFVISKSLREYYVGKGVRNIEILNMFVDNRRFNILKEVSKDIPYIAYCGLVSEHKDGVDCLIKAFDIFSETHPEYRLKIIGRFISSDDEYKLNKLVDAITNKEQVEFVGAVSANEIPTLLCNASILALARPDNIQARYGFPTKLGEYLSTGNPTVVTEVGELHDFLEDGYNIIFAIPDNPIDFANKLAWVADNYTESLLIGSRGREVAQTDFSVSTQVAKAVDFMNATIANL